ncbi:MAG: HypC/HybG/HupF family hydrogenase formation chaperone [Acidaminococcaceae bacterium]|nr:HypC/HybG/HupF family hydrogenase formation chaperone [Acidaminococcaceae bacterium]
MCVAYPGKVLSIEKNHARVDFTGSVVPVNISMVSVQPGDYVLVHAGMAIQKVETEEAKEWIALFQDLEAAADENTEYPLSSGNGAATAENSATVQDKLKTVASFASKTEDTHHG